MTVPPPPPPPPDDENQPGAAGTDPFGLPPEGTEDTGETFEQELDSGVPEVAASKSRVLAVGLTVGGLVLFLLYNIFSGSSEENADKPNKIEIVQAPPEPPKFSPPPSLPISPTAPDIPESAPTNNIIPPPSFNAPNIPAPSPLPIVDPEEEAAARAQLQARQRSGIVVSGNAGGSFLGGGGATPTTQGGVGSFGNDANGQFAASAALSQASRAVATKLGNLRQVIAQGRIIQATMESAINTDLPTQIRAIVSRDVYGEAGRVPLIPKGSRLIGVYNTAILPGQSRVFIVWQRLIRPDGVDVQIGSTGVDSLGVAGLPGFVDSKFQQIFSRAVLASVISIALATGAEALNDDEGTSTTSTSPLTGGTTVTQEGSAGAINGAIDTIGAVTQGFLNQFVSVKPTVIVDQGTPVNVMLNRDLYFPGNVAGAQIIE